jgi:hypothetical protein
MHGHPDDYEESIYITTTEHAGHNVTFHHLVRESADARVAEDGTVYIDGMHTEIEDVADRDEQPLLYCEECDIEIKLERT